MFGKKKLCTDKKIHILSDRRLLLLLLENYAVTETGSHSMVRTYLHQRRVMSIFLEANQSPNHIPMLLVGNYESWIQHSLIQRNDCLPSEARWTIMISGRKSWFQGEGRGCSPLRRPRRRAHITSDFVRKNVPKKCRKKGKSDNYHNFKGVMVENTPLQDIVYDNDQRSKAAPRLKLSL